MPAREPRLLIVDDEPAICAFLEKAAAPLGFRTRAITSPRTFVHELQTFEPIVVILDLMMPDCDGVELLRKMKDIGSDAHVIVISGMDQRMLSVAQNLGHSHGLSMLGVMQKPLSIVALEEKLREVVNVTKAFTAADIERAITESRLELYYQPQITCDAGIWTIDGAEALIRWNHPDFGVLMPGDFLHVIDENDLTVRFTDFVLETGVRRLAEWQRAGTSLRMSLNISARFFRDLSFPDRLKRLLDQYGVPGTQVTLELTESAAMADLASAMDIFLRLRMNGIRLSIDDFGTGYSSLKKLYQLPFDELKIDRTFVSGLPGDDEAKTIVRATIGLAHSMNLVVCAEGVESQAALNYLNALNCDRAQGYLVSPAVPADEFVALCGKWRSIRSAQSATSGS